MNNRGVKEPAQVPEVLQAEVQTLQGQEERFCVPVPPAGQEIPGRALSEDVEKDGGPEQEDPAQV